MKRIFQNKLTMWLLATAALLVLAACGQTPVTETTHTVSVAVTGNGSVTSNVGNIACDAAGGNDCSATVDDGTQMTLTATADTQGDVITWGGACSNASGNSCSFTVNNDKNVTVTFSAAQGGDPELTVVVAGDGSVTSDPAGIDCGTSCTATFASGTDVTLTATEAEGGEPFQSWSGPCSGETSATCTFTLTQDSSVTATFGTVAGPEGYMIATAADDAEELDNPTTAFPPGHTYNSSSDLDLAFDTAHGTTQYVGLRFSAVDIPVGSTVQSAQIVFTAAGGSSSGAVTVEIMGEANATPAAFQQDAATAGSNDISNRTATTATATWAITDTWTLGTEYASADLTAVVQEIVDLPAWAQGNEMVFMIHGTDATEYRIAQSFDDGGTAPVLQVTLSAPVE